MPNISFLQFYDPQQHFLTYPGAGVAQVQGFLRSQGYSFSEIPFVKHVFSNPKYYELFYGDCALEEKKDLFSELYSLFNLDDVDILCIGLNHLKDIDSIKPFLRFIYLRNPALKVVLGGFNTVNGVEDFFDLLEEEILTSMIFGFGSPLTLKGLIDDSFSLDAMRGQDGVVFYDFEKKEVVINNPKKKSYPFPSYLSKEIFDSAIYAFNSSRFSRHNSVFMDRAILFRKAFGCNRRCAYCYFNDNALVSKDMDKMEAELKELRDKTGSSYIFIMENNLGDHKQYILQFSEMMSSLGLLWSTSLEPLPWMVGDPELFRTLRARGCIGLAFGLDSASEELLKLYRRGVRPDVVAETVKHAHNAGIRTTVNVILGIPGETEDMFENTWQWCNMMRDYVDDWNFETFQFSDTLPMFKELERFPVEITKTIDHGTFTEYHYKTKDISSFSEIQDILSKRQQILMNEHASSPNFYFTAIDFLGSKKKAEVLSAGYTPSFKICIGLGSNQASPEQPLPVSDPKLRFVSYDYFEHLVTKQHEISKDDGVLLIGGEPLIHPQLFDFLKLMNSEGIKVVIRTNGRMLSNEKFCKALRRFVDEILVVDFASNEKDYERISKVNGSWEQSRRGMENWKRYGGKLVHHAPD